MSKKLFFVLIFTFISLISSCGKVEHISKNGCPTGFEGTNCSKYNPLIITMETTFSEESKSYEIKIPISLVVLSNYSIDCNNDGQFETIENNKIWYTCKYAKPGKYTLQIVSEGITSFLFDDNRDKLFDIKHWGSIKWIFDRGNLSNCKNLTISAKDAPIFSPYMNSLDYLFSGDTNFNGNINNWNVSQIKSMKGMFLGATKFNKPLDKWDVSNVKDMSYMFKKAENFNQPLNNWNVLKVENMKEMFSLATNFNQPLNNWNVKKVKTMTKMFALAKNFNQSIDSWDVRNVTNMVAMFFYAEKFNQPLNSWQTPKLYNARDMFNGAKSFNQPLNDWIVSNVDDFSNMFKNATSFDQPLNNWKIVEATNMKGMFDGTSISTENYDQMLAYWETLSLKKDVTFDAGNSFYCNSEYARQNIINKFKWEILDKGKKCE